MKTAAAGAGPGYGAKIQILPTVSRESSDRIRIDFTSHFQLGWTHNGILLTIFRPGNPAAAFAVELIWAEAVLIFKVPQSNLGTWL